MKKLIIAIIVIVLVIVGAIYINKNDKNSSQSAESTKLSGSEKSIDAVASSTTSVSATTSKTFALAEVKKHNKDGDCWTTISGKVFDLTTWPAKHPGGDKAILMLCGIDGTSAYNKAHGGQEKPEKVLEGFYIGNLKN